MPGREVEMSYFADDAKQVIRASLLDTDAQKQAEKFVVYQKKDKTKLDKSNSLSSAQLRRFFNEFRQLQKKAEIKEFEQVKPLIKMVKSKAAYAANRSQNKIPDTFKEFLVSNVDAVNTKEEFDAFMLHFEAVVGFFYGIEGVRNE